MTNDHDRCVAISLGDKEAFGEVFRQFYPQLCAYASQICGNREEAEEIVQDVFFRIWQQKEKLVITASLKAYLYKSVHNSCLNFHKHEKVRQAYRSDIQKTGSDSDYSTSFELENKELHEKIMGSLNALPPERQKIFKMIRLEGRRYKDVADLLGISVKTVENQMGKAMQYFRESLKDYIPLFLLLAEGNHQYFYRLVGEFYELVVKMI